jgi:hypothetical protein
MDERRFARGSIRCSPTGGLPSSLRDAGDPALPPLGYLEFDSAYSSASG